jgi:asparagine synthase (glutamine-hydrolysing)
MCGICGAFAYRPSNERVSAAHLSAMQDHMRRRGPDGEGQWLSEDLRAGLGHRRLSIIDLSDAGRQPMMDMEERFVITFNGEIYNYKEIRAELVERGAQFKSHSDTETILELYRRDGPASFRRLRGMYAFAIWDRRDQSMVLARDPMGIKPLYTSDNGTSLYFASQVKALLTLPFPDRTPDPAGHVGFFLWGHVPEPFTLYKGISSFPAGHYQVIRSGHAEAPVSFASIRQIFLDAQTAAPMSDGERRALLHDALLDSVAHHYVADVPVGVFLSAGRDSTAIAALSKEAIALPPHTYTLGFEEFRGSDKDEVPLAEAVASALGTQHQSEWIQGSLFSDAFDDILDVMDQPSVDGINTYFVSRSVAQAGLKVALSGLGGDEMFGGYPSFGQIPRTAAALKHVPRSLGRQVRRLVSHGAARLGSPKYAGVFEYGGTLAGAYLLRRSLFMPWELADHLDADLVEEGMRRLDPIRRAEQEIAGITDPYIAVMLLEMTHYMRAKLLRDSDWASMAHSLELRVPLVDWMLLEQLAPLLISAKRPRKGDLIAAPLSALPRAVVDRPKTGFEVPVRDWLAKGNAPRPTHQQWLRDWAGIVYQKFAA